MGGGEMLATGEGGGMFAGPASFALASINLRNQTGTCTPSGMLKRSAILKRRKR